MSDTYFDKLLPLNDLLAILDVYKSNGKTIVFTNGCFDVIHAGHVRYLQSAAKVGDILVLGLNGDASVTRLKGNNRPVYSQDERAEILAAFECIDYIVIFETDSVEALIKQVKPNVLVKGGDYTKDKVVGATFVQAQGGQVIVLDHVPGRSSTEVIKLMDDKS